MLWTRWICCLYLILFGSLPSSSSTGDAWTRNDHIEEATELPFELNHLLFLLLSPVAPAQESHQSARTYSIPFRSVNGLILLEVKVNGKAAALLLDTGAQTTALSPGLTKVRPKDSMAFTTVIQGARAHSDLALSPELVYHGDFYVMDFAETSKQAGVQIDGLLGENILRDFSCVRIDFAKNILEVEAK